MSFWFGPKADRLIRFRCNICGKKSHCKPDAVGREEPSCQNCGSTVRMRAVVHHTLQAVYGRSMALPDCRPRPEVRGVGLSDWDGYASRLPHCVNYTNTYFHTEPFLDITKIPDALAGSCDFITSTDVFEHVAPPVSLAFQGALKLLKPGGTLVLTVPFMLEQSQTREHFANLHEFEITGGGAAPYRLVNTMKDGSTEVFDDLVFHGGPGTTLEMRVFARDALQSELEQAGFTDIRFEGQAVPKFGIYWPHPWSVPVTARKPG